MSRVSPEFSSVTRKKVFLHKKDLLPDKDGRIYNKINENYSFALFAKIFRRDASAAGLLGV